MPQRTALIRPTFLAGARPRGVMTSLTSVNGFSGDFCSTNHPSGWWHANCTGLRTHLKLQETLLPCQSGVFHRHDISRHSHPHPLRLQQALPQTLELLNHRLRVILEVFGKSRQESQGVQEHVANGRAFVDVEEHLRNDDCGDSVCVSLAAR